MNRCLGTKRDNSPCTVTVEPPKTYCWWHDPANAETRKQAAARGGKRAGRGRPQTELANIKQRLSELADEVLAGEVDKGVAAVASQVLNVYLRAVSVELKAREQLELIERLEALEEDLGHKGGSRWGP
jgi:predicted RNA-binding Zn ribbon-like protein